jgi:hypothetical protein
MLTYQLFSTKPIDNKIAGNKTGPNHFRMPLAKCPCLQKYLAQNGFHCITIIYLKDKSVSTCAVFVTLKTYIFKNTV